MRMKTQCLLLALLISGTVLAASTFGNLENKILEKTRIEQLAITQDNGHVLLEGRATVLKDKIEAENIARRELKTDIVNHIQLSGNVKSDRELTLDVVSRIQGRSSRSYLFNTLSVETRDGIVILTGKVRDAYLAKQAEEAAMEVSGVRSVENRVEILGVSAGDDRLRNLIYRRLQHDDRLFAYFIPAQPSIQIIVDRARVTLVGFVNTEADRARAAILARQVTGSLGVENRLQVE